MVRAFLAAAAVVVVATPALSQSAAPAAGSSLGISYAEIGFGTRVGDTANATGHASVDVAITANHGVQGDLSFEGLGDEYYANATGHLYLAPGDDRKYGVFAYVADMDGRELTWGGAGVEAMWEVAPRTSIDAHVGAGMASEGGLDYAFAGLGAARDFGDAWRVTASVDVAEFDEAAFRAIGYEARVEARWQPEGSALAVTGGVIHDGLAGRDDRPGETSIALGVSWEFGAGQTSRPTARGFRNPDPVAPLLRRGMF